MHYLITGHTGFKGAWLVLMLHAAGHRISGLALEPVRGSLYESAGVGELVGDDLRQDVRDHDALGDAVRTIRPEVVIHLAAQPLVREGYRDPRTTFETNVMGTLNVLDAVSGAETVRAHVIVTTDKVYLNQNREPGYREDDQLGAGDPYSTSKAMADLLAQSWIESYPGVPTAIARAGNVIGGGDVSADRLLPDLVRAFTAGRMAELRYPASIRPWQHVLDCLDGYLALVDALLIGTGAGEWNFGPGRESFVSVADVADRAAAFWGDGASWAAATAPAWHEAGLLALDSTKAMTRLNWSNRLRYPESLDWTLSWQRAVDSGRSPREVTLEQIGAYRRIGEVPT